MAQENQFKCTGDCLNCRLNPVERKTQWQYCAAQFTYNSMRMIESMQNSLESMAGTVRELREKIEIIQNSEADVFDPTHDTSAEIANDETTIAQSGDGADE